MAPRDRYQRSGRVYLLAGSWTFACGQLHYSRPPRRKHALHSNLLPGKLFGLDSGGFRSFELSLQSGPLGSALELGLLTIAFVQAVIHASAIRCCNFEKIST